MTTPVCDFVRSYAAKNPLRLHMPGHKGVSLLGYIKNLVLLLSLLYRELGNCLVEICIQLLANCLYRCKAL